GGVSLGNYIVLNHGATLDNAGSIINTAELQAVTTEDSPGQVHNHDGGTISGTPFGDLLFDGGTMTNEGENSRISASGDGGWAVTIGSLPGTVLNDDGAAIDGSGVGVVLGNGGTITNRGGARIQGGQIGVWLLKGGSVDNEAGS